jgi:putative transposase
MGIQANQYLGRGIQITSIHVADHRRSRIEHRSTKPTGIRTNTVHGRQGNAMIHNYWSHKHVADRLRWTAEEYGMKVRTISEAYTSQTCPRCHSRHSLRVLRGFQCLDCGLEAHRDAVGVLNIAARCGEYAVRPMAWPMLLRWDGCGWNRNNGMPTLERSRVEA